MKKVRYAPPPQIVFEGMMMERSRVPLPDDRPCDDGKLAVVVAWLRRETSWLGRRKPKQPFADQGDAEDVLQDAVVRALERFPSLQLETGRVGPWLSATAYHLQIDGYRKAQRGETRLCRDSEQIESIVAPDQQAESKLILREEGRRTVEAALALPAKLRDVFFMFHRDELSHVEIGAKLGISEDASKMRLFRAHEALRKQLGPETGEILNKLRGRIPPIFFFDVNTAYRDREKNRSRYDRIQRSANVCAALLAASLAFFHVDIPCAKTGFETPPMTIEFANGAQPKENAPEQTAIPAPQTSTAQTRSSAARTPETVKAKQKRSREIDIDLSRVFNHGSDE